MKAYIYLQGQQWILQTEEPLPIFKAREVEVDPNIAKEILAVHREFLLAQAQLADMYREAKSDSA